MYVPALAPAVSTKSKPLWCVSITVPWDVLYHSYVSPPDPEFCGLAVIVMVWLELTS